MKSSRSSTLLLPKKTSLPAINQTKQLSRNITRCQEASDECLKAKSMIQKRLDRLQYQRDYYLLGKGTNGPTCYGEMDMLLQGKTLANSKGALGNPSLYAHQIMEPIYYPLQMPVSAQPVTLPKIEMGNPVSKKCKSGLGVEDLLGLLKAMRAQPHTECRCQHFNQPQPVQIPQYQPPQNPVKLLPQKSFISIMQKPTMKESKDVMLIPNGPPTSFKEGKRNWWKLACDFFYVHIVYSTARKYAAFSKVRHEIMNKRARFMTRDLDIMQDWIIQLEKPLWSELKTIDMINITFQNTDPKEKILKESEILIPFIKSFQENLINKTKTIEDIPENIQNIILSYIKEQTYFPKTYLSTFQINRLDFHFYGFIQNLTLEQQAMLLSYLIINNVAVQLIFKHIKEIFEDYEDYPFIENNIKYLGSIIHYLSKNTFLNDLHKLKDKLSSFNYFRNYHLYNEEIVQLEEYEYEMKEKMKKEKEDNQNEEIVQTKRTKEEEKKTEMDNYNKVLEKAFEDKDEHNEYLMSEFDLGQFWNLNSYYVTEYLDNNYQWSKNLAQILIKKYDATRSFADNILPQKKIKKPKIITSKVKGKRLRRRNPAG